MKMKNCPYLRRHQRDQPGDVCGEVPLSSHNHRVENECQTALIILGILQNLRKLLMERLLLGRQSPRRSKLPIYSKNPP